MRLDENQYKSDFGILNDDKDKIEKALEHALDIRKFEISLYWQRTAYFWALIAAAFAGFFAILSADYLSDKNYLAYIVSCIGFLFTWAWFLVNRGSKYWQENWENHVDMLEDKIIGPLYKTVLFRHSETDPIGKYITGASAISVSKINQWVSFFTLLIWIALIIHALPERNIAYKHLAIGVITIASCILMLIKGQTNKAHYERAAEQRKVKMITSGD